MVKLRSAQAIIERIIMQRQHQFHSVLARRYLALAASIYSKMSKNPEPDQIKAYNDALEIADRHDRTARLFPECDEFMPS